MDGRSRLGAVSLTAWWWLAAVGVAQAPVQFVDEASDSVVLAVRFDVGHDTDVDAAVLAECRLRAAVRSVPKGTACGHRVVADSAVVFVVVAAGQWQFGERFLREVLAPESSLADDDLQLAVAHCALQADDAAFLYPGDVLASRARAQLGQDRGLVGPLRGEPTAIAAITPEQVRIRLREVGPAAVLVLGAVPADVAERTRVAVIGATSSSASLSPDPAALRRWIASERATAGPDNEARPQVDYAAQGP